MLDNRCQACFTSVGANYGTINARYGTQLSFKEPKRMIWQKSKLQQKDFNSPLNCFEFFSFLITQVIIAVFQEDIIKSGKHIVALQTWMFIAYP